MKQPKALMEMVEMGKTHTDTHTHTHTYTHITHRKKDEGLVSVSDPPLFVGKF